MKFMTLALAVSLALAAGCDRKTTTPPSPKTDSTSSVPSASAGSSTTSANVEKPTTPQEKQQGGARVQGQVDAQHADQQRDFKHSGDDKGPQSSDTKPTMKNSSGG